MKEEIIIAGFGGQGVLSMGKILAYCAIMQDMEVTWMPSYGPEMRGGTANVCVIVSDKKISSPIVTKYDTAIILNQQSLDKFESTVKPGGLLIYDPNGIINPPMVGSPCSPRDSQESSPTPQFKSINSLALSFLYGPTLTSKP